MELRQGRRFVSEDSRRLRAGSLAPPSTEAIGRLNDSCVTCNAWAARQKTCVHTSAISASHSRSGVCEHLLRVARHLSISKSFRQASVDGTREAGRP